MCVYVVHKAKFKLNIWGSKKHRYMKRKNGLKLDMLWLFRTNLSKKEDRLKNSGQVITKDKSEIALSSKMS